MSIKTKGSIPERILNKYQGKQKNLPGTTSIVPIDISNLSTNRKPSSSKLVKYIDRNGGFDWALFGMPVVARYPNNDMEIIDGGHRVCLLQTILPEVTTFTACVVDVPNKAIAKQLFHKFNGTSSSSVSNECRFVNEVLGNEYVPLNTKVVKVLNATGVTVYEHEDCYVPIGIEDPIWKINLKAIEWMVKKDIPTAVQSLNLYTQTFTPRGKPSAITNQFAKALQQLLITYKEYFSNEANMDKFEQFLHTKSLTDDAKDLLFKEYSHDRMEQRHLGTAYGLMKSFRKFVDKGSKAGGIEVPETTPIKDVYTSYSNNALGED